MSDIEKSTTSTEDTLFALLDRLCKKTIAVQIDPESDTSDLIDEAMDVCNKYLALFPKQLVKERDLLSVPFFSKEQVDRHNTSSDRWIIIDDNIYNMTDFVQNDTTSIKTWKCVGRLYKPNLI